VALYKICRLYPIQIKNSNFALCFICYNQSLRIDIKKDKQTEKLNEKKIEDTMSPFFEIEMKVRDYECDAQGVVNNANYLHYFETTRHEFMEQCGLRLIDLTEQNILPIVRNVQISYKNSLRGSDTFLSRVSIEREGLKYFFKQDIYRLPEKTLCTKGVVEVVSVINGKVSKPNIFDEAFKDYLLWR
jgi:acyl-CoA thioester hydrolase